MGLHDYAGLDKDSRVTLELSLRDLAERVADISFGTHQLLSHLVDVRRELLAARVATYRARGDEDVAACAERRGDPLADGIEALLREGLY